MYYLTVKKNDENVFYRREFSDFESALKATTEFYRPRLGRPILDFTTRVVGGQFMSSISTLRKSEDLKEGELYYEKKLHAAIKSENAFEYDATYTFIIQSEFGIKDADSFDNDD